MCSSLKRLIKLVLLFKANSQILRYFRPRSFTFFLLPCSLQTPRFPINSVTLTRLVQELEPFLIGQRLIKLRKTIASFSFHNQAKGTPEGGSLTFSSRILRCSTNTRLIRYFSDFSLFYSLLYTTKMIHYPYASSPVAASVRVRVGRCVCSWSTYRSFRLANCRVHVCFVCRRCSPVAVALFQLSLFCLLKLDTFFVVHRSSVSHFANFTSGLETSLHPFDPHHLHTHTHAPFLGCYLLLQFLNPRSTYDITHRSLFACAAALFDRDKDFRQVFCLHPFDYSFCRSDLSSFNVFRQKIRVLFDV